MKSLLFVCFCGIMTYQVFAQNLGICINDPIMKIHVSKSDSALALFENTQPLALDVSTALYFKTGSGLYPYTGAIKTIGQSSYTAHIGLFTFASASPNQLIERRSIIDGGKVGLGITAPQTALHINPNGQGSLLIGSNKTDKYNGC